MAAAARSPTAPLQISPAALFPPQLADMAAAARSPTAPLQISPAALFPPQLAGAAVVTQVTASNDEDNASQSTAGASPIAAVAPVAFAGALLARSVRRRRSQAFRALPRKWEPLRALAETDVEVAKPPEAAAEEKPPAFAWRAYNADWEVHKFGGASLNTADLYKTCGDLLRAEASQTEGSWTPTAAVVSAAGGMTDALVEVVNAAVQDLDSAEGKLEAAAQRQIDILLELVPGRSDLTDPVIKNIQADRAGVASMLMSMSLMRGVPSQMLELVAGLGEVWSAQTLMSYLRFCDVESDWVDARDVLLVPDESSGGLGEKGQVIDTITPLWDETAVRLQRWWERSFGLPVKSKGQAPLLVVTGFVCSTASGRPTTLKRSGSDYSATIFAKVLGSSKVTFWKNVDGVYTADPRLVPAAFSIASMTFDEAMELAYFGGQVLHPTAMVPCIENRIPVLVRNVFNPSHPGTKVYGRGDDWLRWPDQEEDNSNEDFPVKAITSIEKVSLITISGVSFMGTPGVGKRMMEAFANSDVNIILTSQGSSEHSITVAVDEADAPRAKHSLREAFALELAKEQECRVSTLDEVSILSCIGEGMKSRPGIGGRFFSALGTAKVNVIAIAQGSSERNISAVVPKVDLPRALRAVHSGFALADMTVAVGVIGSGMVGTELLRQICLFQESSGRDRLLPAMVEVKRINIEVRAICNQNRMLLAEHGLPICHMFSEESACKSTGSGQGCDIGLFEKKLREKGTTVEAFLEEANIKDQKYEVADTNLDRFVDYLDTKRIPHKILIDCTASEDIVGLYPTWLRRGIHVISPNKHAGAGPMELFRSCMDEVGKSQAIWQYESTVCSQMPVISMLHDIVQTGDRVQSIAGTFSGSMSYIFNTLSSQPEMAFSEAVQEARQQGKMETDIREDLSGKDTARKVLILARDLGLLLELEDIEIQSSLVPKGLEQAEKGHVEEADLMEALKAETDAEVKRLSEEAAAKGERLCYVGQVDAAAGKGTVALQSLPRSNALAGASGADAVVTFITGRYPEATPLVVRGPGAGPALCASGVLADMLRLAKRLQ